MADWFSIGASAQHAGERSAVLAAVKRRVLAMLPRIKSGVRVAPVPAAPLLTSVARVAHATGMVGTKEWPLF